LGSTDSDVNEGASAACWCGELLGIEEMTWFEPGAEAKPELCRWLLLLLLPLLLEFCFCCLFFLLLPSGGDGGVINVGDSDRSWGGFLHPHTSHFDTMK
jgi:hypothetical protein